MMDTENRMVLDRAWDRPIPATPEMVAESLATDAMYSDFDWLDDLDTDAYREIVSETVHACWRGGYKSDTERLNAIRASLLSFIEPWAEREANDE